MTIILEGLIIYLIMALVTGFGSETIAKRKYFPPTGLVGAILVAFGGGLIFAWLFGYVLGWREPSIWLVPIIPTLIGMIVFLIPYFMVRGGYTPYGKKRTWQRKFRR
jgi:uncharacterized membrane protein YeaQ/YmgE (transglycosylase-associated protein family)